jgi:Zn-dependent protease with chaperone function
MLVVIAGLLGLAACVVALYDSIKYQTFNIELRPTVILFVVLIVLALVLLTISDVKEGGHPIKEFRNKYSKKVGFKIDSVLSPWSNDIRRMCESLNIQGLQCVLVKDNKGLASAYAERFKLPVISVGEIQVNDLIVRYGWNVTYKIMIFVIGHELGHIKMGDTYGKTNRKYMAISLGSVFAFGILLNVLFNYLQGTILNILTWLYLAYVIYLMFFLYKAWEKDKYWGEINEFRADRIGYQVSGVSIDSVKKLASYDMGRQSSNTEKPKDSLIIGVIKFLYRKMNNEKVKEDYHPDWNRRIMELELYGNQKWQFRDYIRLSRSFLKNNRKWRLQK